MNEKPSAARRFIAKIPLAGPAARWLWRLITAPGRLVRIERQGEQAQEHLTQIMAQSAHAIDRKSVV